MNAFQPFEMERMMSLHEQEVEYNISESGVHPLSLRELISFHPPLLEELLDTGLNYPYVNGIPQLRQNIAALYEGASAENILVTVGAIEANYITTRTLTAPGDEIAIMMPNYMQIWGIARNHGLRTKTFHLREDRGWALAEDELESVVSSRTKVIAICNPNNPTGYILTKEEMDAVVSIAEKVDAWIIADEVYSGAERSTEVQTPSFYGLYPKVIAVGSMSKAYGLPGLRVGWAVGPQTVISEIWARHEYTTISATMLSNRLAALALSPDIRPRILERTRDYIRRGYPVLQQWMEDQAGMFTLSPPQAAAIAFPRYHLDVNSTLLTDRLRLEKSTLIVPGDHFGLDRHIRISFGLPRDYLATALDRIRELVFEVAAGR